MKTQTATKFKPADRVIINTGGEDSKGTINNDTKNVHGYYWQEQDSYCIKFDNGTGQYIPAKYIRKEKAITKKERRQMQLERHYKALEFLGAKDGKKASVRLLRLEAEAHHITTNQCNGTSNDKETTHLDTITKEIVNTILPGVEGFFINGDARGYALKINDELFKPGAKYAESGLQTDWGGYGLLAPEITGN